MRPSDDQAKSQRLKKNRRGYLNINLPQIHKRYLKDSRIRVEPIKSVVQYREVLDFMFSRIWFYMFTESWIFTAPVKFGQFYIKEMIASDGFFKDWKKSREKGRVIKDYNFHTSGRKFHIKWGKILCKISNNSLYHFIPFRGEGSEMTGKRGLAYWIKKCSEDPYVEDFRGHLI